MIKVILFIYAASQIYLLWRLWNTSDSHAVRLTRLENQKPVKPEATTTTHRSLAPEKPVVKNAKEVKPLEIGDGRMRFDAEAQIAEWL